MKIHRQIDTLPAFSYPVVTVGTFDGVHLGHRRIIGRLTEIAAARGGESIVVTFEPHPRMVLAQYGTAVKLINTAHRKYELIAGLGVDHLIILPFTREFSKTPWETFIRAFIVSTLKTSCLVIGYDHRFGHGRQGDHDKLLHLAHETGFCVEEVHPLLADGMEVSSTRIRNALHEGNIRQANSLLGYPYSITGKVVHGNRIGHRLGFPTANIEAEDKYKLIAANGVYAARVLYNGHLYDGMGNIGVRPTINRHSFAIEVNLFDFDAEIYGEILTVFFYDRLRDEVRFDNLEQLKNQLQKDKEITKKVLAATADNPLQPV